MRDLVKSKGWDQFKKRLLDGCNRNINIDNKSSEDIGQEYMAQQIAKEIISQVIFDAENETNKEIKQSFKYE